MAYCLRRVPVVTQPVVIAVEDKQRVAVQQSAGNSSSRLRMRIIWAAETMNLLGATRQRSTGICGMGLSNVILPTHLTCGWLRIAVQEIPISRPKSGNRGSEGGADAESDTGVLQSTCCDPGYDEKTSDNTVDWLWLLQWGVDGHARC